MTDETFRLLAGDEKVHGRRKSKSFLHKDYAGYKKLINFTEKIFDKGFH